MIKCLSSVALMLRSLFHTTAKSPHTWIEDATTDDIYEALTEIFIKGNSEGISPALTPAELSAFEKNSEYFFDAPLDPILSEVLSFYAGYPFKPIPLSYNGLLRAAITLTSKDNSILNHKRVANNGEEERVVMRGRSKEDRLGLMFSALAGGEPVQEDITDVLALVQPRPKHSGLPLAQEQLRPMAARLMPPTGLSTETLLIPKEKLDAFLKDIHLDSVVIKEDVNFEAFKNIVNEKPGFFDAVSRKVDFLFLDS